jgi:fumarate reductase flavoprotein subunit
LSFIGRVSTALRHLRAIQFLESEMTTAAASKADLVVVGGGIAGLVAANRALELGLNAWVLEAQSDRKYPCASRMSGGAFHVIFRSVSLPPDQLFQAIMAGTEQCADPRLARAIADHAARSVTWLESQGVAFGRLKPDHGWMDNVLAPLGYQNNTSLVWEGLGSDVCMDYLEARLVERGGRLLRGQRVSGILQQDDRCVGVSVSSGDATAHYVAGAVLLADGSFHGNHELLREHVTAHPSRLLFRGPAPGQGDGLRMAQSLGAGIAGMPYFYGHLLSADALHNDQLALFPFIDFLAGGGILVDDHGVRFADEGRDGRYLTNMLAKTTTGIGTAIFDYRVWETQGRHFHSPPNPNLVDKGGTLYQADDIKTLARLAGLPVETLERTVIEYNAALATGELERLSPPRTSKYLSAQPITTPPFYAVPACAAITHAFGGVTIDDHARVLRPDRQPIAGLFAAGANCGGIDGGPGAAYVGGLIIGSVFGMLAAETVASSRR